MAKIHCHPWCVIAGVMTILFGLTGDDFALASSNERSCTVREVLDADGYSYIRCQEGSSDVWIGTLKIPVSVGEQISFTDTSPMVNFQSKSLGRSFSRITFTGVTRAGESQSNFSRYNNGRDAVQRESAPVDNDSIFSGSDENGTIVFSDDPSKVPNRRQKSNKSIKEPQKSINKTPMGKFNKDEQAVIRSLQKVLTVYCSGDLNDYRKTLLPAFRSEVDKLIKENGSNAFLSDMRQQCYREFTANKIFFGKGIPKIAPQAKTASVFFTTSVPNGTDGSDEQTIVEAFFAYHNAIWKFLFFGSISGGNYNIDDILRRSKPLALQHGNE